MDKVPIKSNLEDDIMRKIESKIKNEIKDLLLEGVNEKAFPGGQFSIVTKDKIITDYIGYKSYDPLTLCDGSEIYDVASLTKVISTTTLIMSLVETKKLSLETAVSDVIPEFKHNDITIYDLMIHSSGLPADIPRSSKLKSKEEVLEKVFEFANTYEKGSKVVYSDVGFILLGLVIEKLYDMPLNEAAQQVIFNKLKMNDTSYRPDVNRAVPTEKREDEVYTGYLKGLVHDEKSFAMNGLAGHAGLFSTAYDVGLFIQSILQERFVLKQKTVKAMFETRIIAEGRYGLTNRALGWEKPTDDINKVIMHTGFTGCNMWIDLNLGIGFVLLTNAVHPKREKNNVFPYRRKIRELLIKEGEEI